MEFFLFLSGNPILGLIPGNIQTNLNITYFRFNTIFSYINEYNTNNKEPFIINIIGNVVAFIPFRLLLPIAFQKQLNCLDKLLFAPVIGVLLIELSQLVLQLGVFEINDIILNSICVVIGFVILKTIEE